MIDRNDRTKFEWLDPHSTQDGYVRTGIRVVVVSAFALFVLLALLLLRSPQPEPPQDLNDGTEPDMHGSVPHNDGDVGGWKDIFNNR